MAMTALSAVSAAPLFRIFAGYGWVAPVVVAVIAMHATGWAVRHWRRVAWTSFPVCLLVLALIACWTVLWHLTDFGLPGAATWSRMWSDMSQARSSISILAPPVPVSSGFTLLALWGAGAVAALGDWTAFHVRSVLMGALPAVGMFALCAALGDGGGRTLLIVLEAAALVVYLAAHTAVVAKPGQVWLGHRPGSGPLRSRRAGVPQTWREVASWSLRAGSLVAAAAIATAWAVAPSIAHDGGGLLNLGLAGGGGGSVPREVANPIISLRTRLINLGNTDVFIANSPVASYWRLTSLNTFTGENWISTYDYRSINGRLPGAQSVPPGTRLVKDFFDIQELDSVWLPSAFDPVAVTSTNSVSYDPASDSLITSKATSNGFAYTVESYEYLSDLDPGALNDAEPLTAAERTSLGQYLALPKSVPRSIYQLAQQITSGATTEYQKAIDIQNYLLGPSFTYSLDPPEDGPDVDSLVNFLFVTKTGYCQQFAGSYAVLARAVGLPTRLAFGFTTGQPIQANIYEVTDADTHTWPEVYFGPRYGWLPFEPTKGFSDPSAQSYAGSSGGANGGGQSPGSTPHDGTGTTLPSSSSSPPASVVTTAPPEAAVPTASRKGGGTAGWYVLVALAAAVVAWALLNTGVRRLRWSWRRRTADSPARAVLAEWDLVGELLRWWGVSRLPHETDAELAGRASGALDAGRAQLERLAHLATEAAYAEAVPDAYRLESATARRHLHRNLMRSAGPRRLLRWVFGPMPAWLRA